MMENNPEILQKSELEVMHLSANPVLDYICKKIRVHASIYCITTLDSQKMEIP